MAEQESRLAIRIDSQQALRTSRELSRELDNITRAGDRAEHQVTATGSALQNLAGYMAGVVTVGSAISKMDAYTGIQNRLKLVTKSQEELNRAMKDTFDIAWRSAQSWDAVTSVYTKYLSNAKTLGITQADVAKLTETTSKAVAMSGSTAEAAAGALFQYGQALDGGVLRAEEFNSLVDGAGGLLNAMATGLNVTRGELRQMMLDGKLTGETITKALLAAGSSVETLYSQTDTTIKESFTLMNNALTQFVGEAGKSSGAAKALSDAIKVLAENLNLIAHIAILGGVAAITKAIVTQVIAMKSLIAASVQRRAAAAAELQAQAQLAAMELQRSRQNVAIAAQEIHLARLDLNSATTKQARALAVQRLTAAEIAHNIALNANSKATAANTAATTANNAAKTLGARAAALASAAFLGPAGIVIGVTALTAGYLLMSNHGGDANDMLKDQAGYAGMAADELERLSGNQAKAAKVDLTTAIKTQSQELKNVKRDFEDLVLALYKESDNKDLYRIWAEMTAGVLDTEEAFKRLNAVEGIEASDIKRAADYEKEHRDLNKTLLDSKEKLKLVENGIDGVGKKAKDSAAEIKGFSEEIKKLLKEADQSIITSTVNTALASNGYDDELAAIINKYIQLDGAITKNAKGQSVFRDEIKKKINEEYAARMKEIGALDTRNEKERERTKELEKQAKLTKASTIDAVIASGEGGYNSYNNGVAGDATGRTKNLTGMTLAQVMAKQKGSKSTGRELFAVGKYQVIPSTLRDAVSALKLDKNQLFSPEMQEKIFREYLVSVKQPNVKKFITGKGGLSPALDALAVEFASVADPATGRSKYGDRGGNKASISSEQMAQSLLATQKIYRENIALGMSAEEAWAKSFNAQRTVVKQAELDVDKYLQEVLESHESQAEERKRITNEVADYETQVRNRLKDELEKVDAAGFSDADAQKAKDFYEKQANLDIQAFKDAQQAKLDALKDFQLTEAQLINKRTSDQEKDLKRQQELGELTLEQYTEGSLLIEQRRKQELSELKVTQNARIASYKEMYSKEEEAVLDRYLTELEQIRLIQNELERNEALRALSFSTLRGGVGYDDEFLSAPYASTPQTNTGALDAEYQNELQRMQAIHALQVATAQTNNAELLAIEQEYLNAKAQLQDEYNAKIGVARQADHESQLQLYSMMLSQTSAVWGSMTQMVRDSHGEQSGAYKAMFLMQQGVAMASAMVAAHLAAGQVAADATIPFFGAKVLASEAMLALGYTNVGMIAAQTIAGFKNGGLITGPGTGTSDSIPIMASNEEFMMRNAAVKSIGVDNLNYMNKYGKLPEQTNRVGNNIANTMTGNAVNVQVEPKIIINVPEGYTAQQSQLDDGAIAIDVIKRVVRGTLREDMHNVNSDFGKSLRQTYNVSVKRF
ncbi:tape measure protein [uncultured Acinetobacter sp.]|uniref:tape measure protein n=1 Tax=uncultured Acinetobacter sp. TaxID=165433 RepID=UPI00262FA4F6|nr:tape measure protein [uncultured Acinetobacter sp.]